jgi:uncharacterized protein (TIGR03067 family)
MNRVAMLALGFAVCVGLTGRADDKKADAPKIEGKYSLIKGKKNGTDVDDMAKKAKYIIDDKKITIDGGDMKFVMTYKLDPKASPVAIDMEMVEAPIEGVKGTKAYGIIEAKGDTLKLAYSLAKDERPKDFTGKAGFTFELKKDKVKD